MKYSAKFILAMFNKSKSGKSWIYVDGKTMYIISNAVYNMIVANNVTEVEFAKGEDLMDEADPTKLVFSTMKVKDWTESVTAKLAAKSAEIEAIEQFDQDRYAAAMKKLEGIVI